MGSMEWFIWSFCVFCAFCLLAMRGKGLKKPLMFVAFSFVAAICLI